MSDSNFQPENMPQKRRFFFFPLFGILLAGLVGAVVMWLWNAILPEILGVKTLNYWQAVGLLVLCRILFGSFGGGRRWGNGRGFEGSSRREFGQNWMNMSDEERREMREAWRERCRKD